jgi:hypothetical protein
MMVDNCLITRIGVSNSLDVASNGWEARGG